MRKFDTKPNSLQLRGASKREISREELVDLLSQRRNERGERRSRESAAEKLQSIWKGRNTRIRQSREILKQWGVQYFPIVSNTDTYLTNIELFENVVPPVLNAVLPPASLVLRRIYRDGAPLTEKQLANVVVVRGLLALILRSLSASESRTNYTSLFQEQEFRMRWFVQCRRLLILCCAILGSEELIEDGLLQAASVRIISHLTNVSSWKGLSLSTNELNEAESLLRQISQTPVLYCALRRLLGPDLDPGLAKNHVESVFKSVMECVRVGVCDGELESLFPFIRWVLTIGNIQERLGFWMSSQKLMVLKEGLLVQLKSFFLALEKIQDLSCIDRWIILRNLCILAAGDFLDRSSNGNGQRLRVLITSHTIGTHISLEFYLHYVLRILKICIESRLSKSEHWKQEIHNHLVFAEQVHLMQLLSLIQKQNGENLELLSTVYLTLMHQLVPGDKSVSMPYWNVVAFAADFFPVVWTWIARNLNIPSEASVDDRKKLTLDNLNTGVNSMTPEQTPVVGLFCQSYSHLLLVLDDEDFHQRQHPLSLSQNRAIAVFLSNLAYSTYCKGETAASVYSSQTPLMKGQDWKKVIKEYFPVLLQALYERDNRTVFCPSELWLSPFLSNKTQIDETAFSAFTFEQILASRSNNIHSESSSSQINGLCNLLLAAPQCIPFKNRVQIFRNLIQTDKEHCGVLVPYGGGPAPIVTTIHRKDLLKDAVSKLSSHGERLKGRLFITFVDMFGIQEPGIDQGGLMIELIEECIKAGFDPETGLFQRNQDGFFYTTEITEKHLGARNFLYFLGEMLGKALYEGLLMDVSLAPFFLLRVQEQTLAFDDLATFDKDLHRSLIQVKRYHGDVSDLGLDFSVEAEIFGKRIVEELVPDGANVPVTNDNKLLYVHLMADWHINKRVGHAVQSFSAGLAKLIPISWLRIFNPKELNALLSGGESQDFDLEDLRKHTVYKNGYSDSGIVVRAFWRIVYSFKTEEKAALLKFVTSCSRPPLGGFKHLQPRFTICKIDCTASPWALFGGQDVEQLPTSSTCINMLKLPNYRRSSSMKKKLLLAITSNSGFGFS
eukprot:g6539.t1